MCVCGGAHRKGAKRTAGAAGRAEEKREDLCHTHKCEGSRMGSPGPSAPLLRLGKGRRGRAAAVVAPPPRRDGDGDGGGGGRAGGPRAQPAPSPGSPRRRQHLGGRAGPSPPCPHLMLPAFAGEKSVSGSAQPGRGGEVGEEAVNQLKIKCRRG